MKFELDEGQLDDIAPFAVVCGPDLTIERIGPSLRKAVGRELAGTALLDAFIVERPRVESAEALLAHSGSTFLLRSAGAGLTLRSQIVRERHGGRIFFFGAPTLSTDDELSNLGLRYSDFASWDPTPDMLILKTAQERSLHDLATLNSELSRSADRLRESNRALADAERRYRELVEHQPLVTYIDDVGERLTTQFTSENVIEMSGYSAAEWCDEPDFFFRVLDPRDRERVRTEHAAVARSGEPYRGEFRIIHRDGQVVWIQAADRIVSDEDGTALYRLGYMLDITESKLAAERLREAGGRLRKLVANLQAGVIVEDQNRHVVLTNSAFCGIFGLPVTPDEMVGADCSHAAEDLKHLAADPEEFVRRIDEIVKARKEVFGEEVEFADGRVFERDYMPLELDAEDHGQMWSYRDVTPRVESQRQIEQAHDEAVAASQAKSEFLAIVSHEIRTPMHGVLGAIDVLEGTPLDEEQSALAAIVKRSASSLMDVINDMLDLQRAELGQMQIVDGPLNLQSIVSEALDTVRAQADEKGIALRSSFRGVPPTLEGDAVRIRQVLINLLGNAVKFTDSGHVAVDVTVADAESGPVTTIEVEDSGVGIPAPDQQRIFEPFTQSDSSTRRRHEGSGLGLAITKRLVELMGGTISLESRPGIGTRLIVSVPMRRGAADTPPAAQAAGPRRRRLAGRVLVVEDSEVNRELALRQLDALGIEAVAAPSGEGALLELDRGRFDVVLMDMRMPGMDGIEATKAIRERERDVNSPPVPIVAVTANAMEADRKACAAAGMNGFVAKPLLLDTLGECLAEWLRELEPGEIAPLLAPTADAVHAQLDYLAADLGGRDAVERLAETWLRELPVRLAAARGALESGDSEILRSTAHVLKSTCAMVGADGAAAIAARIERGSDSGEAVEGALLDELERAAGRAASSVRAWQAAGIAQSAR